MAPKKKPAKKLGKKALKQTKGGLNFTSPLNVKFTGNTFSGEKPLEGFANNVKL